MQIREVLLIAVFAAWWLLSLAGQFQSRNVSRLRAHDLFGLLPGFRFFSGVATSREFQLQYRTRTSADDDPPWSAASLAPQRSWMTAFWNPSKRSAAALDSYAERLLWNAAQNGEEPARSSLAYLHLLLFAESETAGSAGTALQFQVAQWTQDDRSPTPLFLSSWHTLPR